MCLRKMIVLEKRLRRKKKTGFTIYAYIISGLFFLVGLYGLVVGIILLGYRYPIGYTGFMLFFVAILFICAGVVQLMGFLNNPDKPVKHMFFTVVVNFIVFSAFLVAIVQLVMEKNLFEYAKETFKIKFARYAYRFTKEQINSLYDSNALVFVLLAIVVVGAFVCVALALVQCCYYVPLSWWSLIGCLILPICVIILGITIGVIFVCLAFFTTPFSHTNDEDKKDWSKYSPAGKYLQNGGIVLLLVAAGLVIYVVVVVILACCYYSKTQKKRAEEGQAWPDSEKVTYEYFRKKDFVLPFNAYARNGLGIILGILSVAAIVVVVLLVPKDEYKYEDAEKFLVEDCGLSFPPTANTLSSRYVLGYNERNPCGDAVQSISDYTSIFYGTEDENGMITYPAGDDYDKYKYDPLYAGTAALGNMTEETRKLVTVSSILAVVPLAPIIVLVILLGIALLCAICCYPLVKVFICGSSDNRTKLEKDIEDWALQVESTPISKESDHQTLKTGKLRLEKRIVAYNNSLAEVKKQKDELEAKINTWVTDAATYSNGGAQQTGAGAQYDKLQSDKADLAKKVKKLNQKIEEFFAKPDPETGVIPGNGTYAAIRDPNGPPPAVVPAAAPEDADAAPGDGVVPTDGDADANAPELAPAPDAVPVV